MNDWLERIDGEEKEFRDLIVGIMPMLYAVVGRIIRNRCSDPADHKRDVVQQAITKVLQAERKRETRYDSPTKVLHAAVWQEAVRHRKNCLREQAVDFNQLPGQPTEPNADSPTVRSPRGIAQVLSVNPTDLLHGMIELSERLPKVSDQDLFVRYFVLGETLNEISRARSCAVMTVQRGVKKLLRELGINDDQWASSADPDE